MLEVMCIFVRSHLCLWQDVLENKNPNMCKYVLHFFGDQNALWKVVREQSRFLVRLLLLKDQEISGHLYDEWNGHEPEKVV